MDRSTTAVSTADAVGLRLTSLLLAGTTSTTGAAGPASVAEVVEWFGAMQAQDATSAAWSLGVRLPPVTATGLREAFERGEAIRTWPMRGTVHYVPPRDAHWMLDLMGTRALAGAAKRRAFLGLSDAVADRAVEVFADLLAGGRRLTRAACLDALRADGIELPANLGYHLLWYASQRGVTCFAPNIGTEQAFMLLDEAVPDPNRPDPEEALALIARRYFQSHGPTTAADFAGWTGLPVTQCRRGIAAAELVTVTVDGVAMHLSPAVLERYEAGGLEPLALPGFDEYMLGYKDRSMLLAKEHFPAVVPGGNGVFQPTIVLDGRVAGTWKRTARAARVDVTVTPLRPFAARDRKAVEKAFAPYERFVGLPCTITIG